MKLNYQLFLLIPLICFLINGGDGADSDDWRSRTIYQIITDRFAKTVDNYLPCHDIENYCGGTFKGIENRLDYIQEMGFDAIWISPVIKNTPGSYHGYAAQDFTKINEHFGTEEDLKSLIDAAHKRGMYVMVDVVANHVGPVGHDFSSIVPFNRPEHYHSCDHCPSYCTIQVWNNYEQVETCRLVNLPDLNQTVPFVRSYLKTWITDLVNHYDFDGLRIDTVPEVSRDFWTEFTEAAGVFDIGEVYNANIPYVASYQGPLSSVLSYPLFFNLRGVFISKSSFNSVGQVIQEYKEHLKDATILGTFIDNHDQPRFLSQKNDSALYKNAIAYTILAEGIPIIYYGTEQGFDGGNDPHNREPLWTSKFNKDSVFYHFITKLNKIRKTILDQPQVQRGSSDQFYGFSRGNMLVALTNVGQNSSKLVQTISSHPYVDGQIVCNQLSVKPDCIQVKDGELVINFQEGEPKVFFPELS